MNCTQRRRHAEKARKRKKEWGVMVEKVETASEDTVGEILLFAEFAMEEEKKNDPEIN